MRFFAPMFLAILMFGIAPQGSDAASIEAVKGKRYKLTKAHGPWMIMVASFHEPPPEFKTDGLTPEEAAEELVFDLRTKGIPAYTFSQKEVIDELQTTDRLGRMRSQSFVAQKGSICVLAGNYKDADDPVAQKTLDYIKDHFKPEIFNGEKKSGEFLTVLKSGGVFRKTPGRPTPLKGAFLTLNPVLSPEEAASRQQDPLLVKLNATGDYSLYSNPKKYTVVVASFYGQSITQIGRNRDVDSDRKFKLTDSLDSAGQNAYDLCKVLRKGNFNTQTDPNRPAELKAFDAYVFHERNRSIVCVGGFDRPDDPQIRRIVETFRAKTRPHPQSKRDILVAEQITIPAVLPKGAVSPERFWIFDPQPTVMPVPKLAN